MAAKFGDLGSCEIPPQASSSPKSIAQQIETETSDRQPNTVKSKNAKASTRIGSGPSSPEKTHPSAPRVTPTKAFNGIARKSKLVSQGKSHDELIIEISELKKALTQTNSENTHLKVKLRKTEEENLKRTESEKLSVNTLLSNLRRKIQRLEEAVKEKDGIIKVLQADAKVAKHEAKLAMETTKLETVVKRSAPMTKETKDTAKTTRAHLPTSRSANGNVASAAADSKLQFLVNENHQLKERLLRALMCYETSVIEDLQNASHEELLAEISRLKGENRGLTNVTEKIKSGSADVHDVTSALLIEEMERLKLNQRNLKEDNLSFYETLQKKELEIQTLKEELALHEKERLGNPRAHGQNAKPLTVPKTFRGGAENQTASKPLGRAPSLKKPTVEAGKKVAPIGKLPSTSQASDQSLKAETKSGKSRRATTTAATPPSPIRRPRRSPSSPAATASAAAATATTETNGLASLATPAADLSTKSIPKSDGADSSIDRDDVEEFRQNVAAKKIQKVWKDHHNEEVLEQEKANMITEITTNHAARVIQHGWRTHHQNADDADLNNAVSTIQAVSRGHEQRDTSIFSPIAADHDSLNMSNLQSVDESAISIQSVARANHHREEMLFDLSVNGVGVGGGGDGDGDVQVVGGKSVSMSMSTPSPSPSPNSKE